MALTGFILNIATQVLQSPTFTRNGEPLYLRSSQKSSWPFAGTRSVMLVSWPTAFKHPLDRSLPLFSPLSILQAPRLPLLGKRSNLEQSITTTLLEFRPKHSTSYWIDTQHKLGTEERVRCQVISAITFLQNKSINSLVSTLIGTTFYFRRSKWQTSLMDQSAKPLYVWTRWERNSFVVNVQLSRMVFDFQLW